MKSFVEYSPDSDFPIQNLPYGVFSTASNPQKRIGVAIGDLILDLSAISSLFDGPLLKNKQNVFLQDSLNDFMALGRPAWIEARKKLQDLLSTSNRTLQEPNMRSKVFVKQAEATMHMPAKIGDYSDFYCSIRHAMNTGTIFRGKDRALMPNWKRMPGGYHGRVSSIVISGTPVRRPQGQSLPVQDAAPVYGPSKAVDFELEVAVFVGGPPTKLGESVPASKAYDHMFGIVLMNDWSARDIQAWESMPLGPFGAKNFLTTISPWVVTLEALEPFKVANPPQDPTPFPNLQDNGPAFYDVKVQVDITPPNGIVSTVCRSNYRNLYWSPRQQLAHQTATGCNINPGDLLASGTLSGETDDSLGCLLEASWNGTRNIPLKDGTNRKYLLDGDEVTLRGYAVGDGYRIGLGSCTGKLLPAVTN